MRAIHQTLLGGPDVLRLVERRRPSPGPTEVLVRVAAAGVNPLDWKTRARGAFLGTAVRSLPALRDGGILVGEQAAAAHRLGERGRLQGKLVLTVGA